MRELFFNQLRCQSKSLLIDLSEQQVEQFYQYYKMLVERNNTMNLTAITEMEDIITKHFMDSIAIIQVIPDLGDSCISVIDVGTGAGFPGIPLKIVFPKLNITLLDSLNKRVGFLDEVITKLGLENVKAIHGRAEDLGRDISHREKYDLCVSRAVANIATLSEYCLPFLKINGIFVSYKSGKIEEELRSGERAIDVLGGRLVKAFVFSLSEEKYSRSFVIIKKEKMMDKKFPRQAGMPSKIPLM